jgi:queuine tRNA-ribosyltransferase
MKILTIDSQDPLSYARTGKISLHHGEVETPVFMPVGTRGAVRGLASYEIEELGAEIMLGNTYHLFERPGVETIEGQGGLHSFMSWKRSILTDSGGFQVFSLAQNRKITDDGVEFRSPLNGAKQFLSPEIVVRTQESFGSDIMMILDECPPPTATKDEVLWAVDRTTRWAKRALHAQTKSELCLFPIVQGGVHADLRKKSLEDLMSLETDSREWPGIAIGGLSVGETKKDFVETMYSLRSLLPVDRPRYLMGVGTPRDLVFAIACGVDMFDCVLPSRNGRHGIVMTMNGRMNLFNQQYANDSRPIDENCGCRVCKTYSRAFLRHTFMVQDTLAGRLSTYHNIAYFMQLMKIIRQQIRAGTFSNWARDFLNSPEQVFLGSEKDFSGYPESLAREA